MWENFRNFEVRINDHCFQADFQDLTKDPTTAPANHYKNPQLEISALRSAMPNDFK